MEFDRYLDSQWRTRHVGGWQVTIIGSIFTKVRYVGAVDRQGEVEVGAKIRTSLDDPATSKQALARLRM